MLCPGHCVKDSTFGHRSRFALSRTQVFAELDLTGQVAAQSRICDRGSSRPRKCAVEVLRSSGQAHPFGGRVEVPCGSSFLLSLRIPLFRDDESLLLRRYIRVSAVDIDDTGYSVRVRPGVTARHRGPLPRTSQLTPFCDAEWELE